MPLVTTELSEAEFEAFKKHMVTLQVDDLGAVLRAAIVAFDPKPPVAVEAERPHAA